jgi:thymidylate synthase (FAD)
MANVNEYSTRYSVAIDSAQTTSEQEWRIQASGNRQGSAGFAADADGKTLTEKERYLQSLAREIYDERLKMGIAREQARKDLPLSTYTEGTGKLTCITCFTSSI